MYIGHKGPIMSGRFRGLLPVPTYLTNSSVVFLKYLVSRCLNFQTSSEKVLKVSKISSQGIWRHSED